jgi:hypothetical protein
MNRKQQNNQQNAWLKQQERIAAGYVKDRFPDITSIQIRRTFVDFDTDKHFTKEPEIWNIPLTMHALFQVECPMYECVDGGFDLTGIVEEMIKNKVVHQDGSVTCPGWQDQERIGQHRCMTKLLYEIDIQYLKN